MFYSIRFSDLLKASFGQVYLVLLLLGVCSASINLVNVSNAMFEVYFI